MISAGFNIAKGDLFFTILEGTRSNTKVVHKGRLIFDPETHPQDLAVWFEKNFQELLGQYKPDRVGYRASTDTSKDAQLIYMVFPWGILNLSCQKADIPSTFLTSRKFTHRFFDTNKPFDKFKFIDDKIGQHPPNWNNGQRLSALSAFACLDD